MLAANGSLVSAVTKLAECIQHVASLPDPSRSIIANIGPMADWGLELSKRRVVVDASMHANLPRVLAAGDLATYPGKAAFFNLR